ncbi:MAG: sulfatase [Phycisphaerae bacterium]|nr:sulfatase [Phycisphaerae bacterium]
MLASWVLSVLLPACAGLSREVKPNILFIMSDDHTTQAFGSYRSRLASLNPTPNIDRLAKAGMIFDSVFCNNSICTPSRASIITGQYPQTNGVLDLDGRISPEKQFLPREMKQAGYLTAMIGKWHLKEEPAAFDYYNVLPGQGQYHNPVTRDCTRGAWPRNTTKHVGHSSDVITDLSIDWLKHRDKTKPFFLMHHFKAPHDLFSNAKRYDSYLEDTTIPEPDNLYDQPARGFGSLATRGINDSLIHTIGASVSKRCNTWGLGKRLGIDESLPEPDYTRAVYQTFLKRYLRCVKGVDDNVQRLVEYLKEEGIYENTLIIYTGDQGYFLGEHDFFDKRWMYEEGMRMPFIAHGPGFIAKGSRCDLLINNTDFAPTLIDMAGGRVPEYMQGRSFKQTLLGNKEQPWRDATYYRYWMHMAHNLGNPAHFGIRTHQYKLIFFYGVDYEDPPRTDYWGSQADIVTPPGWELYDIKEDPHEMNNLYGRSEYAETVKELKAKLRLLRQELNETDAKYPHIQTIIDAHWND